MITYAYIIDEIICDLYRYRSSSGNCIFDEWSPCIIKLKLLKKKLEEEQ